MAFMMPSLFSMGANALGSMFGGNAMQKLGFGLGPISNTLFGPGRQTGTTTESGRSGFDQSQLPFFMQSLGLTDQASATLRNQLGQQADARRQQLQQALGRQTEMIQGLGEAERADIQRAARAAVGTADQRLAGRGLYNTTIAESARQGIQRNLTDALAQQRGRERQYLGTLFGQQAQALDRAAADRQQMLAKLGFQDYGLRALLPQAAAKARRESGRAQRSERKRGFLERLFG